MQNKQQIQWNTRSDHERGKHMKRSLLFAAIIAGFIATPPAFAADSTVTMNLTDEQGSARASAQL